MSLVKNLFLNYEDFKIDIPQFEISDTGVTALCGPSGSGKTTIVRTLLGLEDCPNLIWDFKGVDLAKLPPGERRVGVVFQTYDLFPHLSGMQNVLFAARARDISTQKTRERIEELSEDLKTKGFMSKIAAVLSGGEKQRIALMRAIIGEPRILFLDEPFTALDAELKTEARNMVKKVIKKYNIPVLFITHDDEDLKILADRILRLQNGRLG